MKRLFLPFMIAGAIAPTIISCTKEGNPQEQEPELAPGMEKVMLGVGSENAKTAVDGTTVTWVKGDEIKLFDDEYQESTGTATQSGQSTTFESTVYAGKNNWYAFYPSSVAGHDDDGFYMTIPAEQDGSFATSNFSAGVLHRNSDSRMTNQTGFIKLAVSGDNYSKIVISAVGDECICGRLNVMFKGDAVSTNNDDIDGSVITLKKAAGNLDATTYYIAVAPGVTLSNGLLVKYYEGDNVTKAYYIEKNLTPAKNKFTSVGTLENRCGKFYVSVDGAGAKSGGNWANAMGKTEFLALVTQISDDNDPKSAARAAMLKDATFYFEGGEYDFGAEVYLGFNNDVNSYINFTFDGGYYNGSKDVQNHPTIISGNNEHCIFILSRYTDLAIIDCNIKNSYGNGGGQAAIRLESKYSKIQLTRCNFNNNTNSATAGGLNIYCGTASLTDCVFSGNTASAAAAINIDNGAADRIDQTGAVSISGCTFDGNTASSGDGGAVKIQGGGPVSFNGCTFINNTTTEGYGAVMYVENAEETISFTDCVFGTEGNGNISANSGGVARFSNGSAAAKFDNCTFAYNEGKYGGAISLTKSFTGNVTINGGSILNCSTPDNNNREGGAIMQEGGNLVVDGLKIDGCTAVFGGAYSTSGGTAQFKNCEFGKTSRNTATLRGGCIYSNNAAVTEETHTFTDCWISGQVNSDGGEVTGGGARVGSGASPTFTRCTFDNCTADGTNGAAGAFWIAGSSHPVFDSCTFSNCSNSGTEKNGGAFAVSNATGHPYFSKCKFNNCVSSYRGGAFYSESIYATTTFDECEFTLCYSPEEGGAIDVRNSCTYNVNNCNFHDNYGPWGTVYVGSNSTVNITGGNMTRNIGKTGASGSYQVGAAIYGSENSKVTCDGVVFDGNEAKEGPLYHCGSNNNITAWFNSCVVRNNHWTKIYGCLINMPDGKTGVDIAFNNCTFIRNYINEGVEIEKNSQNTWFNLNPFTGSVVFSNCTIWGRTYQGIWKEEINSKEQYGFIRVSSNDNRTLKLINSIVGNSHKNGKAFTINGSPTIVAKYCLFSPDYTQSGSATWDEVGTIHTAKARGDCYGGHQGFDVLATADYVTIKELKGDAADFAKQPTDTINTAIQNANSGFYDWLNSIGALGKDCRGYTRNPKKNWPGAYDNDATND